MAKPHGTNKKFLAARDCVDKQTSILEFVLSHVDEAWMTLYELMGNKKAQAAVRSSAAKTFIEYQQKFAKEFGKKDIVPEDFLDKPKIKKTEEPKILSLTYDDYDDEDTGTDG